METKPPQRFHQLRSEKVLSTFHVRTRRQCQYLEQWVAATAELLPLELGILDMAQERYERLGQGWNEEELKMHFISPVLNVANPNIESVCKTFFERPLTGIIDNYELNIVTDCMVASYNEGGEPVRPYFFLQEYKQAQRFGRTDPQGQVLAAMLLAQVQNADGVPLYGCYVIERNWFFTTLIGLDYCVSRQYNSAEKADLLQIVYVLRNLRELILARQTTG